MRIGSLVQTIDHRDSCVRLSSRYLLSEHNLFIRGRQAQITQQRILQPATDKTNGISHGSQQKLSLGPAFSTPAETHTNYVIMNKH